MKNFLLKIYNTPLIHSLLILVIGAVLGAVEPIMQNWLQGNPIPTMHVILITALKAAVGAVIGYYLKNGLAGGSGSNAAPIVKALVLLLCVSTLTSCGTIFGGKITDSQKHKPAQGHREIRPAALVGDIIVQPGLLWLAIDFADGAIYKPTK